MVNINGKTIADVLTDGMNDGLPWLAPFSCKGNLQSDIFCNSYQLTLSFDTTVERTTEPENAKFLPYVPQKIAYVPLNSGEFAISGKFTGCLMGAYYEDGKYHVCHIATGEGAGDTCKIAFANKAADEKISFLPSMIIGKDKNGGKYYEEIRKICEKYGYTFKSYDDVYGIITSEGELYSFITAKKGKCYYVMAWEKWEIREKDQVQILDRGAIKFGDLIPFIFQE